MRRPVKSDSTRFHRIETHLQASLGSTLAVVCLNVDGDLTHLREEEHLAVSNATIKRQREFAAGRAAARMALRRFGYLEEPIPANKDRSPRWPDGIVGSISHSSDTCLVVLGQQSSWHAIGVDIEAADELEESLWPLIATDKELALIRRLPCSQQAQHAKKIFVAKEAFFKWHYPQRGMLFDFLSASVQWNEDEKGFSVSTQPHIHLETMPRMKGRFFQLEDHWIATCTSSLQSGAPTCDGIAG